jgi:hypothetical protein
MVLTVPALYGRSILIAHGEAFQAGYLADVVRTATGLSPLIATCRAEAFSMLVADPVPHALTVHSSLAGSELSALVDQARLLLVPVVVLEPSGEPIPSFHGCRSLHAPYAAFQVVELLASVIAEGGRGNSGSENAPGGQGPTSVVTETA